MAEVKNITSQKAAREVKLGDEFIVDIFPDPPVEDDDLDEWEKKFQTALERRNKILAVVEETLAKQAETPESDDEDGDKLPPGQVKKSISG